MGAEEVIARVDASVVTHVRKDTRVMGKWGTTWCGLEWRWEGMSVNGPDRRVAGGALVTTLGDARRSGLACPRCLDRLAVHEGMA